MKRAWEQGYGDGSLPPPPKVLATAYTADDFGQDDFSMGMGGGAYSMYGGLEGGMSFEDGAFSTGDSRGGGGSLTNRLKAILGPTATATLNPPPKPPTVLLKEEMAQSGQSYNYGQGMEVEGGSGYDYDQSGAQLNQGQQGYDQSYGYNESATYGADANWSYDASGGRGYDASGGGGYGGGMQFGGGRGMGYGGGGGAVVKRGRGRGQARGGQGQGQARGQVQQRGRGRGQSFQYQGGDQGAGGNQAPRGRGRGQGGFGQQGQGQDNRGWGRGQGQPWKNNDQSGGFQQKPRGRGRGNYSGGDGNYSNNYSNYEEQDNTYSSYNSQNQTGYQNRGRGGYQSRGRGGQGDTRGRGRGNQRGGGFGRGSTAGQVQAVSDNIMGMVRGGRARGGRGRGARGRGGPAGKPTSFMDMVDSAYTRKFSKTSNVALSPEAAAFNQFLEFFLTCPDRVNGIQTIGNAQTASRLSVKIEFEAEQLCFIIKPLFTGVLKVGGVFLTRGLGLSKKAVKHDCFERAVEIMRISSLEEILVLEDCGKETLREEVERQSKDDIEAFKSFLSAKAASSTDASVNPHSQLPPTSKFQPQQKQAGEVDVSQQIRTAAVSESQPAERNFPLADKMMMLLKEIEKSGMEEADVAMASRYDVLCFKVGIRVAALYKVVDLKYNRQYNTSPYKGDPDINLICEIYYDDVLIGEGEGRPRKEAQIAAYNSIQSRLMKEPVSQIAQGPKIPPQPEALPNFFEIIHKGAKPQSGNNHHRMMSLRSYPPDLTKSMGDMVIIEMVGDTIEENAYKILEYSASKNSMLLEWKQLDKGNNLNGFRCEMSVNGQKSATGMGASKPKARNAAAAMILMDMYMSNDVISSEGVEDLTKATSLEEITARAEALKLEGPPRKERVENVWHEEALSAKEKTADTPEEALSQKQKWMANPLQPWFEDAIVEMMVNHGKKLTLEELIIGPGITPEMRRFVTAAAKHCLLGSTTKEDPVRGSFVIAHQRSIVPEEMAMILRINKGASGRYKLVRDNKQISVLQQAQFVRNFPEIWRARAKASLEADKGKKGEVSTTSGASATTSTTATTPTQNVPAGDIVKKKKV
ncbi:hypothetical protein V1264_006349 [Littorina saxatilis]|uniref:DRBM domain-containing protein n=1 Tax=Littorina saxatilis TaxID=31220 RepID=A0AAN9AXG0_9CAEN